MWLNESIADGRTDGLDKWIGKPACVPATIQPCVADTCTVRRNEIIRGAKCSDAYERTGLWTVKMVCNGIHMTGQCLSMCVRCPRPYDLIEQKRFPARQPRAHNRWVGVRALWVAHCSVAAWCVLAYNKYNGEEEQCNEVFWYTLEYGCVHAGDSWLAKCVGRRR